MRLLLTLRQGLCLLLVVLGLVTGCQNTPEADAPATDAPAAEQPATADTVVHALTTYRNERFDYAVGYPADVLEPQGEPQNEDDQRFVSPDGAIQMTVFGQHNVRDHTIGDLYVARIAEYSKGARHITLRNRGADWVTATGMAGDTVFHHKTLLQNGIVKALTVRYPDSLTSTFRTTADQIVDSFRPASSR